MTKYCYFLITLLFFYIVSLSHALNNGFSVELIHRDASKPPLQRVTNAIRRSLNHVNYYNLKKINGYPQTTVIPDRGEYLMSYSIGTPRFKLYGIVDTGSDVIWFQCKPCVECYNQTSPLFDPSKSRTYKNIPCSSSTCQSVEGTSCSNVHNRNDKGVCKYTISYGDRSKSQGDLSTDTLTLDSTRGTSVKFPNTVVGCGNDNTVSFSGQSSGIVGLGGGSVSFTTQLSSSIRGKFSYCLIPFLDKSGPSKSSSKLNFGDAAIVSGKGTISTPIVQGSQSNVFYYLSLEAFSVGAERIDFRGTSSKKGNIIIDSGTTLTLLPSDVYTKLESAVAKVVKHERVADPSQQLSLCYKTTPDHLDVPVIISHFKGGDVLLKSNNTFVQVDEKIVCFAFTSTDGIAIFGNLAQQNFLVGYDLQKKRVSFKPTDCTK